MRHVSVVNFTCKKRKAFPKKAKRFEGGVICRDTGDISCSIYANDRDVKSVSEDNMLSSSANDKTIFIKTGQKKLGKKRTSTGKWDVTESSPSSLTFDKEPATSTESSGIPTDTNKRKAQPLVKNSVYEEGNPAGEKEKTRKKWRRHLNAGKGTRLETNGSYADVEGVSTNDADELQSAFEGELVTAEEVERAAEALLKLIKITAAKRGPSLFESEAESVHMQINSIRVPRTPTRRIRFSLPHPVVTETTDICLFVPDLKKGPRIDHEPTVAHYRELLDRHGVKGITQIMPVRQLKDEYFQFEMRRRLCNSYDMFLADGRICGPINPLLGKEFHVKRKLPTPVNFQSKNLKEAIEKALSKTALTVTPRGDSTLVKIGHSHHSPAQLTENIMSVIEELTLRFPGGWHNIRALSLKTSKSLRVPFYVTEKSANSVEVPIEKPRRPKAAVPVEGELSTIPGARVVVLPSGEVIVKKEATSDDSASEMQSEEELEDEEEDENDAADAETNKEETKEVTKVGVKSKAKPNSGDDSDSGVEAAEDEYLSGWMQEFQESESHNDGGNEPAEKKPRLQHGSVKQKKKTKLGKTPNTAKSAKKIKKTYDVKGSEKKKKVRK